MVAFNASPWNNGNTSILIGRVSRALEGEGIECELVQLAGKVRGVCTAKKSRWSENR